MEGRAWGGEVGTEGKLLGYFHWDVRPAAELRTSDEQPATRAAVLRKTVVWTPRWCQISGYTNRISSMICEFFFRISSRFYSQFNISCLGIWKKNRHFLWKKYFVRAQFGNPRRLVRRLSLAQWHAGTVTGCQTVCFLFIFGYESILTSLLTRLLRLYGLRVEHFLAFYEPVRFRCSHVERPGDVDPVLSRSARM